MTNQGPTRTASLAVAGLAVAVSLAFYAAALWTSPPTRFDDSYMFLRYAHNMLAGYGHAWNRGGPQTYGSTSLLHVGAVTLLKFGLPRLDEARLLLVASAVPGVAMLGMLIVACAQGSTSRWLRGRYLTWAALLLPVLVFNGIVLYHHRTGMDTMLSALCNTLVIWCTMRLVQRPTTARLATVVVVGYLAFLARPDNGLYATLFPVLCILLLGSGRRWVTADRLAGDWSIFRWKNVVCEENVGRKHGPVPFRAARDTVPCERLPRWKLAGVFLLSMAAVLLIDAAAKWTVFGTPLPLPFYAKQHGAYAGYMNPEGPNPFFLLDTFLSAAAPLVCILLFLADRRSAAMLTAFLLPVGLTFAYYFSVNQIMGAAARFDFPSLPFFVVAAALVLDSRLQAAGREGLMRPRELLLRLTVLLLVVSAGRQGLAHATAWYQGRLPRSEQLEEQRRAASLAYPTPAAKPLPAVDRWEAIEQMARIAEAAPKGTVMAMSEYGLVGARAPDVELIDLVGLHDRQFALHGFSASELFRREPDLIWLAHYHYTNIVRDILQSEAFQQQYVFYPGAFDHGVAIRKDSPRFEPLSQLFVESWRAVYGKLDPAAYQAAPLPQ